MICLELAEQDRWRILRDYHSLILELWKFKAPNGEMPNGNEFRPVQAFLNQDFDSWKDWCNTNNLQDVTAYCERMEAALQDSFHHQDRTGMLFVLLGADFSTMKAIIQWMQTTQNAQYISVKKHTEDNDISSTESNPNSSHPDIDNKINLLNSTRLQKAVFSYDYFRKQKREFQQFLACFFREELGVTVCPYCNRNWITSIPAKKRNTQHGRIDAPHMTPNRHHQNDIPLITPQVDHFFPKINYPYLALSLFNLVPSCPTCNNRKHEHDTASDEKWQWYPYEHDHCGSVWFQLNLDDYLDLSALAFADLHPIHATGQGKDILEIISSSNDPLTRLELERLYRSHIREVQKTVFRIVEYCSSYWELQPNSDSLGDDLKRQKERFDQQRKAYLLQGADWDERLKITPLGKMKHDLGKQLLYNENEAP